MPRYDHLADQLRRTSGNRQRQKDVTALQAKIVDLQGQHKTGNGSYAAKDDLKRRREEALNLRIDALAADLRNRATTA
ncbi:hypothetical protein ACGFNP_11695 [Nonomuraea sp. NPDC049269]|uniref:hypothetical protein n=1 Tax=Nonomuraea sp. NPDC049269 TaxID=3364349 RepID=UPI003712B670